VPRGRDRVVTWPGEPASPAMAWPRGRDRPAGRAAVTCRVGPAGPSASWSAAAGRALPAL